MNNHGISVLGATGSVGEQVIEVIEEFPERFDLAAVAAESDVAGLARIRARHPRVFAAAVRKPSGRGKAPKGMEFGDGAVMKAATHPRADLVVVAISGFASLKPTMAAIEADKDIALASKEALVVAGELVMAAHRETGRWILPIDSEHSAIWQCRWGEDPSTISGITLTGSGGPFRTLPLANLSHVTVEDALKHPTWKMGPKITIDSATMMNKALELIELHHLFDIPYENMRVVIHPQSIVHSLVDFVDGSTKALLGQPDMRVPISITLGYPERLPRRIQPVRLDEVGRLDFEAPDPTRYPALGLGLEAGIKGRTYPAVLNAANEVAVQLFVEGQITFDRIVPLVAEALAAHDPRAVDSLETLIDVDRRTREWARSRVGAVTV